MLKDDDNAKRCPANFDQPFFIQTKISYNKCYVANGYILCHPWRRKTQGHQASTKHTTYNFQEHILSSIRVKVSTIGPAITVVDIFSMKILLGKE